MSRIARVLVDGFVYHVPNRGNARQEVFHKDQNYGTPMRQMRLSKDLELESTIRPGGQPGRNEERVMKTSLSPFSPQ